MANSSDARLCEGPVTCRYGRDKGERQNGGREGSEREGGKGEKGGEGGVGWEEERGRRGRV